MQNKDNKKKQVFLITLTLFLCGLLSLTGYGREAKKRQEKYLSLIRQTIPIITPRQLEKLLSKPSPPVLLDTRQYKEYYVSHLAKARSVGYRHFSLLRVKNLPKETPIVVYCSLGIRSEKVGMKLKKAGYTNIKNLLGGLFEWVNLGLPVYDSKERPTPMVHAYSKRWGKWLLKGKKIYKLKKRFMRRKQPKRSVK